MIVMRWHGASIISLASTLARRNFFQAIAVSLALLVCACSKPESPEQRIRAMLSGAEQAAEKRDVGSLLEYVSDNYTDTDGRNRHAMKGILRLYVLGHASIHLLTRIESIALPQPSRANVVIYVATAGRPITQAAQLAPFRASLYRLELGLVEEDGDWRVLRATWRPAEPSDFIR